MQTMKFIVKDPRGDRSEDIRVDWFVGAHNVGLLLERVPEVSSWECLNEDGRFCVSWDRARQ